jgi:AcrR family transcriptional regulator
MGYPEHLVLVVGHLNEAIHELPDEAFTMKQTLEFCAAKTVETDTPFVPLWAILSQLLLVRRDMKVTDTAAEPVYDIGIDFTPEVENEYGVMDPYMREELLRRLEEIDQVVQEYKKEPGEYQRFHFSGLMASTAEMVAAVAPALANMLRDRRLAFTASPDLMDEAGYGIQQLLKDLGGDHSGIDLGVQQGVADDTTGVVLQGE